MPANTIPPFHAVCCVDHQAIEDAVSILPRLWHNLRSTRRTELEELFASHLVSKWIGNSEKVTGKYYLQLTDDHFQRALQNPVQQVSASVDKGLQ